MLTKRRSAPILFSLALAGLTVAAAPVVRANETAPEALGPLLTTINERLNIADLVALTKWDSGKPVQDSVREAQVIAGAQQEAAKSRLDANEVAQLLAAQIEANKLVQYGLLATWHSAGKAPDTKRPDLAKDIRPQLDELQIRLLQQYASFESFRTQPDCTRWLNQARSRLSLDELHQLALIRATGELCAAADPRS